MKGSPMVANGKLHLIALDDDKASAKLTALVAERCGYFAEVLTDSHGLESMLASVMPDVITLDLSMPAMNGLEVLELLRRQKFGGRLIIISGHPTCMRQHVSSIARTAGLTVAGQFQKPISTAELSLLLNEVALDRPDRSAGLETTARVIALGGRRRVNQLLGDDKVQ
jgi:CheY-like chemotaxis protein